MSPAWILRLAKSFQRKKGKTMRIPCIDCTIKHLSTALALEQYAQPHNEEEFAVIGNIMEASSESWKYSQEFSYDLMLCALAVFNENSWLHGKVPFEHLMDIAEKLEVESYVSPENFIRKSFDKSRLCEVGDYYGSSDYRKFTYYAHMAQAAVLDTERWQGYPQYWKNVVGHLNAAANVLLTIPAFISPHGDDLRELAAIIREHRIKYVDTEGYPVPFYWLASYIVDPMLQADNPFASKILCNGLEKGADGELLLTEDTRPELK